MTLTVAEIMQAMPQALIPEKAAGVKATVLLDFSGEGGKSYVVRIDDGRCEVGEGPIDQPDAVMLTTEENYVAIVEGRLDAMKAFMTGQLKVKGNLNLLLKFQQMFDPSRVQS
jgi:putative sterol carrier protein